MKQQLEHYFNVASPTLMGNDLSWLKQYRADALVNFLAQGFPTRHEENWKYTDLSFLEKAAFSDPVGENISEIQFKRFQSENKDIHRLVFVDGHFSQALSSNDLVKQCVITSLQTALTSYPENLQRYFLRAEKNKNIRLLHLNTALMSDGFYISIPKNTVIEKLIQILFISSGSHLSFTRNILELEENSQASVFEEHLNVSHLPSINNHLTQIMVDKGASLDFYKLQDQNDQAIHLAQTVIEQARDSSVNTFNVTLGGKLSRDDLQIALNAQGASCNLQGLYVGDGDQHIDHHTRIDHLMPHGTSQEYYKGILSGKSKGVFNGKVIVHPGAQKTVSQQTNKNLLLSKEAEADTKPELEIYADDVACAHGATVGQIDPESLFYLRSRGIDKLSAMMLMINAFADEILSSCKNNDIAQYIRETVHEKMNP